MRAIKCLACCGALLLLAACSAARLAYNHFDTLARWQISDYVDLTAQQRQSFNAQFYPLWTWHRQTQLPLYAADLKDLAGEVQAGPLSLRQIEAASARIAGRWNDLAVQMAPGYARVLAQLSDAQVADLIRRIGKEVERRAAKQRKLSAAQRRQHRIDDMDDSLREWIGRPNPAQRQLLQQWAAAAVIATSQQEREQGQHARLDRYAALLASRTQPEFEDRLRDFMLAPDEANDADEGRSVEEREQERQLKLLADLSATLEPAQREHLRQRLLDYAADFEALAAEPPPQNPDPANP